MKSSVEEIIKQIPDFEEFIKLADQIRELSFQKLLLEKEIKEKEANVYRTAVVDSRFFVGGKSPAVSYVKSAYEHSGLEGEILPLREQYAKVSSDLEHARITMDVYKSMLDVYRTVSANERGVSL